MSVMQLNGKALCTRKVLPWLSFCSRQSHMRMIMRLHMQMQLHMQLHVHYRCTSHAREDHLMSHAHTISVSASYELQSGVSPGLARFLCVCELAARHVKRRCQRAPSSTVHSAALLLVLQNPTWTGSEVSCAAAAACLQFSVARSGLLLHAARPGPRLTSCGCRHHDRKSLAEGATCMPGRRVVGPFS